MFKVLKRNAKLPCRKAGWLDAPCTGLRGTRPRLQDVCFSLALQSEHGGPFRCGVGGGAGRAAGAASHLHRC